MIRSHSAEHAEKRGRRISLKSNIVVAVFSLLVALLLLEIGVRSYDAVKGRGFFWNYRNIMSTAFESRLPFRTFGFFPYVERDGVRYISSRHDDLYPLEKPEGTFRIVAFGGSSTENIQAVRKSGIHYPLQLQSELRQRLVRENVEVINVANSAYATPHSLILLELDVLSWEPDLVILSHNTNDLSATYWPDFTFDYSNKYSDPYYLGEDYKSRFTTMNAIFQHFQLYWVVKDRLNRALNKQAFTVKRRSYGDEPDPAGVAVFERNLQSFVALAKSNGVQVLLVSQPYYAANASTSGVFEKPYNKSVVRPLPDEEAVFHAYYNKVIRRVAADTGAWFLDNAQLMPNQDEYFSDSVHYTIAGVERLAGNYADFLVATRIIE